MKEEMKELRETLRESAKSRALPIIQDREELRKPNKKVKDTAEAGDIAEHLWDTLSARAENDVGLSAPQIGIHKTICVVRAKEPIVLVNPEIIETDGQTWYQEGCVSFPGESIRTTRHKNIVVKVDWVGEHNGMIINWSPNQTLYFASDGHSDIENDIGLLESVAVQHETDHLNGILFYDRERKIKTVKNENKVGRNESCPCGSQKKYKKCCGKI
jgi:peptide deformylase